MQTNLTMVGDKWAVEVIGGPDDEILVKTFSGREDAAAWVRAVGQGEVEVPALKPKKAAKSKPQSKAKSVKP